MNLPPLSAVISVGVHHATFPFQFSGFLVSGVPPLIICPTSDTDTTFQLSGISLNSVILLLSLISPTHLKKWLIFYQFLVHVPLAFPAPLLHDAGVFLLPVHWCQYIGLY